MTPDATPTAPGPARLLRFTRQGDLSLAVATSRGCHTRRNSDRGWVPTAKMLARRRRPRWLALVADGVTGDVWEQQMHTGRFAAHRLVAYLAARRPYVPHRAPAALSGGPDLGRFALGEGDLAQRRATQLLAWLVGEAIPGEGDRAALRRTLLAANLSSFAPHLAPWTRRPRAADDTALDLLRDVGLTGAMTGVIPWRRWLGGALTDPALGLVETLLGALDHLAAAASDQLRRRAWRAALEPRWYPPYAATTVAGVIDEPDHLALVSVGDSYVLALGPRGEVLDRTRSRAVVHRFLEVDWVGEVFVPRRPGHVSLRRLDRRAVTLLIVLSDGLLRPALPRAGLDDLAARAFAGRHHLDRCAVALLEELRREETGAAAPDDMTLALVHLQETEP